MAEYALTVFSKKGEKLMDEKFEAANDKEAKQVGKTKLAEKDYLEQTHRCVSPMAKLVLFHK